jgi:hypothetical protein
MKKPIAMLTARPNQLEPTFFRACVLKLIESSSSDPADLRQGVLRATAPRALCCV